MKHKLSLLLTLLCLEIHAQTYQDGDSTFNLPVIHTIHFTFTQPNYWDSLLYYYPFDQPMAGTVSIDGLVMDSVGVQLKGNSSFNSIPGVKKSIKISFDEYRNQKYDGLKTINLNNGFKDPTFLREKLMLDFLRKQGAPAPRCSYADVYINGTHWGFYMLVEQVNKTFLNDVLGNKDGNLFKGDPHGDLKWKGSSTQLLYETDYELKTNETINDWSDLIHLIDYLNNTPAFTFYDSLETVLNTDLFLRYWACSNIFVNLDSYLGSGHNYYIYHNTVTNRFDWISWDVNEAFGNFQMGMNLSQLKNLDVLYLNMPATSRPLINGMIQNNTYKTAYLDLVYQYLQQDFSPWVFYPVIDSLANVIRPFVYADPNKQFTNANFDFNLDHDMGNIPGLKDFVSARRNNLGVQLVNLGYNALAVNEIAGITADFNVYPNPAGEIIFIDNNSISGSPPVFMELNDALGRSVISKTLLPSGTTSMNLPALPGGVYFCLISNRNGILKRERLIIQ